MKKIYVLLLAGIFFSVLSSHAQITISGYPYGTGIADVPVIGMPEFKYESILKASDINGSNLKGLEFAKSFNVDYSPKKHGVWTNYAGKRVWQLALKSEDAYSLNVIFDRFELTEGVKLFLYNKNMSHILGAFSDHNNKPYKMLAVSPVRGDHLIIEMQVPQYVKEYGSLRIGKVSHDFLDVFKIDGLKDGSFGASGDCNIDVACIQDLEVQRAKRAVCRIIYLGNQLCTGALINNTRQDATPYILTANHCISNQFAANSSIFTFNYESPSCNGPDGSVVHSISGSDLVSTGDDIDFSLLLLSEMPTEEFEPYYLGWNANNTYSGATYSLHHPWGDVKKIAVDAQAPDVASFNENDYLPSSHWHIYRWEKGVTERGSSGGPLISDLNHLIGTLTGGDAACSYPYNDFYQMMYYSFDHYSEPAKQLKYWLDPENIGIRYWDGYDPYNAEFMYDTLKNYSSEKTLRTNSFSEYLDGYWTGHNSKEYSAFAEKFENSSNIEIIGLYLNLAHYDVRSRYSKMTLKIWSGKEYPGIVLAEKELNLKDLDDYETVFSEWDSTFFVGLDTLLKVQNDFFAGFEIEYETQDAVALKHYSTDNTEETKLYLKRDFIWERADRISEASGGLGIGVRIFSTKSGQNDKPEEYDRPVLYPNPASDQLAYNFVHSDASKDVRVQIIAITGQIVYDKEFSNIYQQLSLDIMNLKQGIYVCKLYVDGEFKQSDHLIIYNQRKP